MKNWKTTTTGILSIIIAVSSAALQILNGDSPDIAATIAAVVAGLGLVVAQDKQKG